MDSMKRWGAVYTRKDGTTKLQVSVHGRTQNCPVVDHVFTWDGLSVTLPAAQADKPQDLFELPFPLNESFYLAQREWKRWGTKHKVSIFNRDEWPAILGWSGHGSIKAYYALNRALKALTNAQGMKWADIRSKLADQVAIPDSAHFEALERQEMERERIEISERKRKFEERRAALLSVESEALWMEKHFGMAYLEAADMLLDAKASQ